MSLRQHHQCSGHPWSSTTGSPAPASATCKRTPPASMNRCSTPGSSGSGRIGRAAYTWTVSLIEQVRSDTAAAMKAGDKERVQALRLISNELQKAAKESTDGDETAVLQRERKRRLEAAEAYADAGREDLAAGERREAEIIEEYMPEQLSDEELHAIVGDAVAESGAASPQEMGKVMSLVMPKVQGRADGKRVSSLVREKLALDG